MDLFQKLKEAARKINTWLPEGLSAYVYGGGSEEPSRIVIERQIKKKWFIFSLTIKTRVAELFPDSKINI